MKAIFIATSILILLSSCGQKVKTDEIVEQSTRGVWLTNVASDALESPEKVKAAVQKCYDLGFNTIYTVTWNKNNTMFKSSVAERITGNLIDPKYGNRDPLREVIEEAHALDMKVLAWFEFGFASAINDTTGGILIQKNPAWASLDKAGKITEKNDFYWLNPFHPEVQDFITSMIVEAVENYDLDGIQGDDRLPALPSNGGYDSLTVSLYKSEHNGSKPPVDHLDQDWISWRSEKLTEFLADLVTSIRSSDPDIIISMAPSIYPWSENNYLQDWPSWLERGLVDEIIPQVYRYNFTGYKKEIDKIVDLQVKPEDLSKVDVGVLLQVNDYISSPLLLDSCIQYHRSKGIGGEVYFFYEGIKKREDYFTKLYKK